MKRTEEEWIKYFKTLGAFWRHDDNPKRPHALLTAGGHSNGFFNWSIIAECPLDARDVATDIVTKLTDKMMISVVERVVGPGYGAITLADRLAEEIQMSEHISHCKSGFTEKQPDGTMKLGRFNVIGQFILPCEDTITSGKSVRATIDAVTTGKGRVVPYIAAVCNRSGLSHIDPCQIVALINVPMANWTPEECPLCKQGSEAIRPKKENWERLNAEY